MPSKQTAAADPSPTRQRLAHVSSCTPFFWCMHSLYPLSEVCLSSVIQGSIWMSISFTELPALSQCGKTIFPIYLRTGVALSGNCTPLCSSDSLSMGGTPGQDPTLMPSFLCWHSCASSLWQVLHEHHLISSTKQLKRHITFFLLTHLWSCPSRGHNNHPSPSSKC